MTHGHGSVGNDGCSGRGPSQILAFALPGWGFAPRCWNRVAVELEQRASVGGPGGSGEPSIVATPLPDLVAMFAPALDAASLAQARSIAGAADWQRGFDVALDAWIDHWIGAGVRHGAAFLADDRSGSPAGQNRDAAADGILLTGWSLGGLLALEIARRIGRRAEPPVRVLLVATHPAFSAAAADNASPDAGAASNTRLEAFWTAAARPERLRQRFLRLAAHGEADPDSLIASLAADWEPDAFQTGGAAGTWTDVTGTASGGQQPRSDGQAVAALRAGLLLLSLSDRRVWPQAVRGSALFFRDDAVVPLRAAEAWMSARDCRLAWLSGGHAALHARPAAIADAWCSERARFRVALR